MRCLLAIPVLAGLMLPPIASAQFRIGPRSLSASPPGVSKTFARHSAARNFAPLSSTFPTISPAGGAFSVVSPFRVQTRSPWEPPAPRPGIGREFGGERFHGQQFFYVNPFLSYPFPYANYDYAPMFYPSLWPPLDQQYLQAQQIAKGDVAGEVASQQSNLLNSQILALSQEVESLRQERAPQAPGSTPVVVKEKQISAVFVYRDGRAFQARDYAIYNQTLWVFGADTIRKIPLSALDLTATEKLNEQRGVDVALPSAR